MKNLRNQPEDVLRARRGACELALGCLKSSSLLWELAHTELLALDAELRRRRGEEDVPEPRDTLVIRVEQGVVTSVFGSRPADIEVFDDENTDQDAWERATEHLDCLL